jgi:class 3 adenylate cyclase/alpha-beta hydrolase superfamily lysophospholipase
VPETRYAKSGGVHIAYQVVGTGPIDLVVVPGWVSHIESTWEHGDSARFFERLASFSRLILFDKRGTGLSDRVAESQLPTLEQRMDDVRAVMEAAGSTQAALFGISEGGPMSFLFAATYPERTVAVVAYGSYAKWIRDGDYPWAPTRERHDEVAAIFERRWGEPMAVGTFAPSMRHDEAFGRRWARLLRAAASPAAAVALYRMNIEIDVRHVLPAVRVPTLLLHRTGDRVMDVGGSRYIAQQIPGAKLVELPGDDHVYWLGNWEAIVGEIEEFLTGVRHIAESDRVLSTVLFTDIVESTERVAVLGDTRWRDLLASHHGVMRRELARFRGREVDTAGDGFFATFDGPARAIRCACAAVDAVRELGLQIRAGLHTGECELMGDRFGGIAVHIGARVAGLADPGEVLVSSTVKDLVAGSGLRFADRGTHRLKGVPGEWRLFSVVHE